jgi:hypothetical protein
MGLDMNRIAWVMCVAGLVAGCVSKPVNPIASFSDEERTALKAKTETPAGFSTVQFKDFGDTKRNAALSSLIRKTWGEECKPISAVSGLYNASGSSVWRVRCDGGNAFEDYSVALPERADGNAVVLQCYQQGPRSYVCSPLGRPAQ